MGYLLVLIIRKLIDRQKLLIGIETKMLVFIIGKLEINSTAKPTATRNLSELVEAHAIFKSTEKGAENYYEIIGSFTSSFYFQDF